MKKPTTLLAAAPAAVLAASLAACDGAVKPTTATPPPPAAPAPPSAVASPDPLLFEGEERHLRNVRQLTFGGENAEAYFGPGDREIIFQSTRPPHDCDQIFTLALDAPGAEPRLVSSGKGRTTCAYLYPDGSRLLYASTHLGGDACPPVPDRSRGYVWAIYDTYDIFSARPDGTDLRRLTNAPGYDAEATIAPDGSRIVFTSVRDGDLELYSMALDGSDVRRLTDEPGYDGGAFFSPDSKRIVWRASRPRTPEELAEYRALLAEGLVRPTLPLEIHVMNADGSGKRRITDYGCASFAPFFHPDGERIIFSSNKTSPSGRDFDLYLVRTDGTGLERLTTNPTFDGFPMFSRDGRRLVFASNRHAKARGETNVFIADWVD